MKNKREIKLEGEKVTPGIAMGPLFRMKNESLNFPKNWICGDEIPTEKDRYLKAILASEQQLKALKTKLCSIQGREQRVILDSHILLVKDEFLLENTLAFIEKNLVNAEWAAHQVLKVIGSAFSRIDHTYIRERKDDIEFVERIIINNLMGLKENTLLKIPKGSLIAAENISPSEALALLSLRIKGLITENGSANSHMAIVARAAGIPCLVRVKNLFKKIKNGDKAILDGSKGLLLVNPSPSKSRSYEDIKQSEEATNRALKREARSPAATQDHFEIKILGNIDTLEEAEVAEECGAVGIGLYRTEFLFLNRPSPPSVAEQESIYRKILQKNHGEEVTIRTIDLGADKIPQTKITLEENPALGLRAVRYCLKNPRIFSDQIRALLRASVAGNLKICIPLITSIHEFWKVKKIIAEVREELQAQKVKVASHIPLGVMVETPSAALEVDLLCQEVDFISVGTNDLIQYVLAVDRNNDDVAHLYSSFHPSILRLLKSIREQTRQWETEVTICGEMASDPASLLILIALGYRRLSMNAVSIPKIKKIIRLTSRAKTATLLEKVLKTPSFKEARRLTHARLHEMFPDFFGSA